jgi:hypothetical protein
MLKHYCCNRPQWLEVLAEIYDSFKVSPHTFDPHTLIARDESGREVGEYYVGNGGFVREGY